MAITKIHCYSETGKKQIVAAIAEIHAKKQEYKNVKEGY